MRREPIRPNRPTVAALVALTLVAWSGAPAQVAAQDGGPGGEREAPRLVLQITVDQLRGDLLERYGSGFGEGGFAWLLDHGTVYTDAHHAHANTETIVGHSTLATGAHPSSHGMVGNTWLDPETGVPVYNIEDGRYRLLVPGADVDADTEIDPTQRAARSEGRSPAALRVPTFSDALAAGTEGRARIFAVSVKDRGAVPLAGHAGTAFWFSKAAGAFVTSSYYGDALPPWLEEWNGEGAVAAWGDDAWSLTGDPSSYRFAAADDQPWEQDLAGFGRTFPHPYGPADGKYYTTLLTLSPAADELTGAVARRLLAAEGLGQDEVTDYLSVSFSATDYVGHIFGASSLEAEDNLRRLDRTLAQLLAAVDERVGLEHTVVVLSADHGGPDAPGYHEQLGVPGGYVDADALATPPGLAAAAEALGVFEGIELVVNAPYVDVRLAPEDEARVDRLDVERAVAACLARVPGVAAAFSGRAVELGQLPDTALARAVARNHDRERSGDVHVVFEPGWFINDFDGLTVAVHHGTPWAYDTHVPVIFAGAGIPAQRVHRRVHTVDVAPTLSALAGVAPPAGADGVVLVEALSR